MQTLHGIDDLLAALETLRAPLDPSEVAATLRTVRVDERSLAPYLNWAAGGYTRNLVARTPSFELIAICWDRDARSLIHDHAESDCAFVLQRGAMVCEDWLCRTGGESEGPCTIARVGQRPMRGGDVDLRTGHLSLHRVASDGGPAVSLHVYARPIESFFVFEESGACRRVISRYDSVPPDGTTASSSRATG